MTLPLVETWRGFHSPLLFPSWAQDVGPGHISVGRTNHFGGGNISYKGYPE